VCCCPYFDAAGFCHLHAFQSPVCLQVVEEPVDSEKPVENPAADGK